MIKKPARVCDIHLGLDSRFDAWLYSLLIDNNLAHSLNPQLVASQEQLSFMVQLDEDQVYLPCSDATFALLGTTERCTALQKEYNRAWRVIVQMVRSSTTDYTERKRILQFCLYRYRQLTSLQTILPQRLIKRMTNLVLSQCGNDDPWIQIRHQAAVKQQALLNNQVLQEALGHIDQGYVSGTMSQIRQTLNGIELLRLLYLTLHADLWEDHLPDAASLEKCFADAWAKAGPLLTTFSEHRHKTVLYLCDATGAMYLDLQVIKALLNMGHRVIYAVKNGFHFHAPTIRDMLEDPLLEDLHEHAKVLCETNLSKNELLQELRTNKFLIINDGTRERMNLYRVSVTFARAWKESDVVIAKGWRAKNIFLDTSHNFTRDIICTWINQDGFQIAKRPHSENAHKFSEDDINKHAEKIIKTMRKAHREHKSVMFFSCIIGSIPGQTKQAIALATTFVEHLRSKLDNVLIINPAEHFIPGMDGDDLMYMWERVQRSGQIDIWHFQTSHDIEMSFALQHKKVPQIWSGKDATYSTGCTKEMRIALEVQQKNREMQIIGPDPKLFFRRGEYGVGKYFDTTITK